MANPNKTYNLPCKYLTDYQAAGDILVIIESVKIGGRYFRVNVYPIEVE